MGKFRRLVKAEVRKAMGNRVVHRIRMLDQTITNNVTTKFNLLSCDDDPDYDLATDGTNVAECHPNSRIVAVQLHVGLYPASNPINPGPLEWMIARDPDGALGAAGLITPGNLYAADVTTATDMLRKNVWAMGHMFLTTNRDAANLNIRISRKALRRARIMRDGDKVSISFTNPDATDTAKLYIRGRIISKTP